MSMGNPDGATPPHTSWLLTEVAQRPDTHGGYSASKGIPRLRRAISHWYQARCGGHRPRQRGHRHHRLEGGISPPDAGHASTAATPRWCPTRATPSTSTAR